ncbi:MAG: N-acetylglucosamine kinase [Cytophagaceae bacterium]|jgi:N-acetylglucosamine kinase-like BadF-type ATPase|nr:N-acetylglucosamine kinase [Cytophagaceae bacterium]
MILIADGGSTKVDWSLVDNGKLIQRLFTAGINPFFRSADYINTQIRDVVAPTLKNYKIDTVYFYGAGCAFPEKNEIIQTAITQNFDANIVTVGSDLLGAAIGLCGNNSGIACILGTGSNSCSYDGSEIRENVSPLGYILGDEGSGAVLGRLFIGACLKNRLTHEIKEKFLTTCQLNPSDILDRVYRQPAPNLFLASIAPFIRDNINNPSVYDLVLMSFTDFFKKNVMQYDYKNNKVFFTGSIAFHFQDVLKQAAANLGIEIETIVQSPMDGLITHYSSI